MKGTRIDFYWSDTLKRERNLNGFIHKHPKMPNEEFDEQ